ncbi:hypothetical protein HMPREF0731_4471, partial [Pseudoroseomonas cervicalis ATCC 49957]
QRRGAAPPCRGRAADARASGRAGPGARRLHHAGGAGALPRGHAAEADRPLHRRVGGRVPRPCRRPGPGGARRAAGLDAA